MSVMMKRAAIFAAAALFPVASAQAEPLRDAIASDLPSLMTIYRDLHANPELSFQEIATSAKLAVEARRLGFTVTTNVGGYGVVAILKNGKGPTLMIRADMDGLPVEEQTGLPFASKVRATGIEGIESGVMHACGHDTHMTSWIGTARRMSAMKDKWSGTLVMIGQPAEERNGGARKMLDAGLYTRFPKPDVALAFHDSAGLPAGVIGYTNGYALANVDTVDVTIKGVGGHGAYPHTTKDPIVLAARIVGAFQTLVSREIDPIESAVVTVGAFHSGAKHNIISDKAELLITVRSYKADVRKHLLDGIARIARGEAIAAGIPEDRMPVVRVMDEFTPATFNTNKITTRIAALFESRFGKARTQAIPPTMGGEDFSEFWLADKSIESMIFWVGGVPQAQWDATKGDPAKLSSLHSPYWAPDAQAVIATATEALTSAALDILAK